MSRLQITVLGIAVLLFVGLYFGGSRTPKTLKDIEQTRSKEAKNATINEIIGIAKTTLSESNQNEIAALESELEIAGNDTIKLAIFEQLSGKWYTLKSYGASGFYAEEIAQLKKSALSWSIAGSVYANCFQVTKNERVFNFCFDKAITAFENAASIEPDSIVHKENLAFCYTSHTNPSKTMEGVKIYQGILSQDERNLKVLLRLGKLSVDLTRDYPKAINRLEKAVEVAPNNFEANYYLAQAYAGDNNKDAAKEYFRKSLVLTNDSSVKDNIKQLLNNL